MTANLIDDFANKAHTEIGRYRVEFMLSPTKMMATDYGPDALDWESVSYGLDEVEQVPNDKRGLYAFAICQENGVLPPHCYILYIGIAGKNSDRSLRERYRDYLNDKKVLKRERIARMIGTWRPVLRFLFVPVNETVTGDELEKLERQLNTALLPPFSIGDLEAETKRVRRAFQ